MRSSYSNYGSAVTIAAPGGDGSYYIWSTIGVSPFYGGLKGTSMAAPHVTGTIALMLSANPTFNHVDNIITALTATVSPFASLQSPAIGAGIVNTLHAVDYVSTATVTIPSASQLELSSVLGPLEYCDPIQNKIPHAVSISFSLSQFSGAWALKQANCLAPASYNAPVLSQSGQTSIVTYTDTGNGLSSQYQFTAAAGWQCQVNDASSFLCSYRP
jgi:subtilisin family serine protease